MREIRTKTVHVDRRERTTEAQATIRAESFIESETTCVHTIMYADGDYQVFTYRRAAGAIEWTIDSRVRGNASGPTRFTPRSEASRQPVEVVSCGDCGTTQKAGEPCTICMSNERHSAADNYLAT